jgi:hypothetical protein
VSLSKDELASVELAEYFRLLESEEEKNTYMRFGEFKSKRKLSNGYTVQVTIRELRKGRVR